MTTGISDRLAARRSVSRRLKRDLAIVALAGAALLLGAAVFLYWTWISSMPPDEARIRAVRELIEHVILPLAVLMVPVVFVVLRVIRQAFQPLADAAARIENVEGHERGFRIDAGRMPAEALPFVRAVNGLLARLDEVSQQQEAFAADVAHELRTPLALLSLELDGLPHADARPLKADVATMRRLIDQLLLLAQIDAGPHLSATSQPVVLVDVAGDVVAAMAPAVIAAGRTIELEAAAGAATIAGRTEAIAAALRNLIENAVRVTPPGGAIRVVAGPDILSVCDEGPGLTPARLADLATRHRRADHASHDGAGLGLAIVTRIMAAHGGRLETDPDQRRLSLHF